MVSHPGLGLDPSIGSDRESGRDMFRVFYEYNLKFFVI